MTYLRHTLCYLTQSAKPISMQSPDHSDLFHYWLTRNYPFIVTRQTAHLSASQIQLAIPYFDRDQAKKIRAQCVVDKSALTQIRELPNIDEVFPDLKLNPRRSIKVYGSFCWQYLTQEPYVQQSSDLDLLIPYEQQSLSELAGLYTWLQKTLDIDRIDGEIRFPEVGDCSWRELLDLNSSDSILFKSTSTIDLLRRETLYATVPALIC